MIEMITHPVRTTHPHVTIRSDESDWTAEDWDALDHGNGTIYEVIDGVLYMTTAPSSFHQWIISRVYRYFAIPLEDAGEGIGLFAPIGVFMSGTQPVQPDFVAVSTANIGIIRNRRITGIPDLIMEILSPRNADHDLKVKYKAYERAGVPEYIIIRPAERALTDFRLGSDSKYAEVGTFSGEIEVSFDLAPAIRFRVQDLFDGAPDTTL